MFSKCRDKPATPTVMLLLLAAVNASLVKRCYSGDLRRVGRFQTERSALARS